MRVVPRVHFPCHTLCHNLFSNLFEDEKISDKSREPGETGLPQWDLFFSSFYNLFLLAERVSALDFPAPAPPPPPPPPGVLVINTDLSEVLLCFFGRFHPGMSGV